MRYIILFYSIFLSLSILSQSNYDNGLKSFEDGKWESSLYYFKLSENDSLVDSLRANSYHYIASILYNKNKNSDAIFYFNRSYNLYNRIGDYSMANNELCNIGTIYSSTNNVKSLQFFRKALLTCKDKDKYIIYNNIGSYYKNRNNLDSAIFYYKKASINNDILSLVNGNLGDVYYSMKDYDKSLTYYEVQLKVDIINNNLYNIISTYLNMTNIYIEQNKLLEAKSLINKSISLNRELNDLELQKDIYEYLYRVYKVENLNDSVYIVKDKIYDIRDTLLSRNNKLELNRSIEEFDVKYKVKEQNLIIKNQSERSTLYKIVILFIVIILGVLTYLIIKIFIQKKKVTVYYNKLQSANKEIYDSILYAKELQKGLMSSSIGLLQRPLSNLLYKPKDIVSGDFYFYKKYDNLEIIAIADCTGHGIPGSIMTAICYNALTNIMTLDNIKNNSFNKLVEMVSDQVYGAFSQDQREKLKDGMDISICLLDNNTNKITWVGANNPLWLIRRGFTEIENSTLYLSNNNYHLWQFKPNKSYIGCLNAKLNSIELQLNSDDNVFLFTDGIKDQFGGVNNKKLKSYNIAKNLLSSVVNNNDGKLMINNLSNMLDSYSNGYEQTDDITFFGFKVL